MPIITNIYNIIYQFTEGRPVYFIGLLVLLIIGVVLLMAGEALGKNRGGSLITAGRVILIIAGVIIGSRLLTLALSDINGNYHI